MKTEQIPRMFEPANAQQAVAFQSPLTGKKAIPYLLDLWRSVMRRKWVIASIFLVFLFLGWSVSKLMTPIYQASATLLIEAGKAQVVSIKEVYAGASPDREHFQTQAIFIGSREVGSRVVRSLNLVDHPGYRALAQSAASDAANEKQGDSGWFSGIANSGPVVWLGGWFSGWFGGNVVPTESDLSASGPIDSSVLTDPAEEAVLGAYTDALTVEPIRQSQLVMVKFASPNPVLAARVANQVARSYIQAELDMRLEMTLDASTWLAKRLVDLRGKLDESQAQLTSYKRSQDVFSGGTAGSSENQQVEQLNRKLVEARIARARARQVYNQVRPGAKNRRSASIVVNNSNVTPLRESASRAKRKFERVRNRFGSAHPAFRNAKADYEAAKKTLDQMVETVISGIAKDYRVTVATERALNGSLKKARAQLQDSSQKSLGLSSIEQEVAANRQLYQTFLSRMKETSAAADIQTPVARLVDAAVAPSQPIEPRTALIISFAGLFGLFFGIGVVFLRDQADNTLRTVEDVETLLSAPVVATLPLFAPRLRTRRGRLVIEEPELFFSEMVRMGAASVLFSSLDPDVKSIAITSALAEEGKSTVSCNLALTLARTKKVLLIDADLHRPRTARMLGLPTEDDGLIQVLCDDATLGDAIVKVPYSGLQVLCAGPSNVRPLNLLSLSRFKQILAELHDQFDLIIVDSPPIEVVSDGMLVSGSCDRSILVTRAGSTPVSLVLKALNRLRTVKSNLMGVILNGHDFEAAEKFYGEDSGYESYELYSSARRSGLNPDTVMK